MKLRAVFLGKKEPLDWEIAQEDGTKRKGQTHRIQIMLENADTVLLKVPEDFYRGIVENGISFGNVVDIVFEPRVVLDVNRRGRAEQNLKILPASFEYAAASMVAAVS